MGAKNARALRKIKLEPDLEQKLNSIFHRFDLDGNGTIEKQEIVDKFVNAPEEGQQVARLFSQMDADNSGGIDMDEYILFWKGVRAQGKSVESIIKQLDTLLTKVDALEKTQRQSKALNLARESSRIGSLKEKLSNKTLQNLQDQLIAGKVPNSSQDGQSIGEEDYDPNVDQQRELEELERQIEEKTTQKIEEIYEDFENKIKGNRSTILNERNGIKNFQNEDMPETRESVKMVNRQLEIEDDSEDQKTRFTVINLDDYTLELKEKIACLKAQNDLYEFEELGANQETELPIYQSCIQTMAEIIEIEKKIEQAADALLTVYKIDQTEAIYEHACNISTSDIINKTSEGMKAGLDNMKNEGDGLKFVNQDNLEGAAQTSN